MIVSKTNPQGIDYFIDRLQKWIQPILYEAWGLDPVDPDDLASYKFFPRVNRNPDPERGFIAELYLGNGEYKEVYYDDTLAGLSWFGLGPRIQAGVEHVADVHLVTFANLKKLYPGISHRADEEIRSHFQGIFEAPNVLGFSLVSTEIWLANVLKEYPGSRRDQRLDAADMGEAHAFRLNLRLSFDPSQACPEPLF
jgi:hypothetical protein